MAEPDATRTTAEKIEIFRACFSGLSHVYGTYDTQTGRAFQVKKPVTNQVLLWHIGGIQPYGVYLLVDDRTRALAVDFDDKDMNPPMGFLASAKDRGLSAYIEVSKSKGCHVWLFFEGRGVLASKARAVAREILTDIGHPDVEIFPKHDRLDSTAPFGNFVFAPLFGRLVPQGRTVFVDEANPGRPYPDQWEFLANVRRVPESHLDDLLGSCLVERPEGRAGSEVPARTNGAMERTFGLPPCARTMLSSGVEANQRSAAFRLAVQLRKAGLPEDITVVSLRAWALKNSPVHGKGTITQEEIASQVKYAYARCYRGCGCDDPAVKPFCSPACALWTKGGRGSDHAPGNQSSVGDGSGHYRVPSEGRGDGPARASDSAGHLPMSSDGVCAEAGIDDAWPQFRKEMPS